MSSDKMKRYRRRYNSWHHTDHCYLTESIRLPKEGRWIWHVNENRREKKKTIYHWFEVFEVEVGMQALPVNELLSRRLVHELNETDWNNKGSKTMTKEQDDRCYRRSKSTLNWIDNSRTCILERRHQWEWCDSGCTALAGDWGYWDQAGWCHWADSRSETWDGAKMNTVTHGIESKIKLKKNHQKYEHYQLERCGSESTTRWADWSCQALGGWCQWADSCQGT